MERATVSGGSIVLPLPWRIACSERTRIHIYRLPDAFQSDAGIVFSTSPTMLPLPFGIPKMLSSWRAITRVVIFALTSS